MSGSTQPVFSILTSVYRTEAYFPETIESVRAQTLQDWELVVVDNGMSDEVVRIVEKYSDDPRIRLVRQENNGLGGGIDAAAAVARGRYYAVLDSDDLLMPTFCERTAAILDARPEIDVVGIDAYLFEDEDGQDQIRSYRQSVGIRTPAELEHPIGLVEMIGGNVLYYTAAIRAEAWARGGGYSCDTPKVEDLAMFLRMLAADCDIRCLPERLARYRLRADSFSRDPAQVDAFEASLERAFLNAQSLTDAPDVQQALDRSLRKLRFDQAMRRARKALIDSDIPTARRQARRAFEQRRSVRPAAVYAGLLLAPGILRNVHPAKQWLSGTAATLTRRGRALLRPST
ncbi:glycosyl transferase family 2 [Pseudonocardia cypriaca]|uniref:Glycosyl transferase family 2 n=1 Tax=Pseudonocardia cypriaca TaxID=882449 RepID=A0A543GAI1_9PSEU|nr:glycosyl transferase family 2 [Pseudonocardia cypriaca]